MMDNGGGVKIVGTNCTGMADMHNDISTSGSVTIVAATVDVPLVPITHALGHFLQTDGHAEGLSYTVKSKSLPDEVDRGDFQGCSHVLLCEDMSSWSDPDSQRMHTYHLCMCMKAAFRVNADVCIGLIGDSDEFRTNVTTLCQDFPEFRWLLCSGRLLHMQVIQSQWIMSTTCVDTLIAWLTVSGRSFEPHQLLDYKDMAQIMVRDLKEHIPELMTIARLSLLSASGMLGILVTVFVLAAITHVPSEERSIRTGQQVLRQTLERQRLGKCEWEPGDDAMALMALQLYKSDWCFHMVENQRSIDRMEIHLLATVSRARNPTSRELTPVRLSQYINALLVTYHNPRDFHGHDLVLLLEAHVLQQGKFNINQGVFSRSLSIIALHNAKVALDWSHLSTLVQQQQDDGSFGHSIDETCMSIIALSCGIGSNVDDVIEAINSSVNWLQGQRSPLTGAYGHTYSTALALQAFNVSGQLLSENDWQVTLAWLLRQTTRDPAIRNIEIASQTLLVLAGRTMLSIRNFTGLDDGHNEDMYRTPRLLPHIYVDGSEGMADASAIDSNSTNNAKQQEEETEEDTIDDENDEAGDTPDVNNDETDNDESNEEPTSAGDSSSD